MVVANSKANVALTTTHVHFTNLKQRNVFRQQTFAKCSIVTMTLESLDTRSIAPPIPFTILPCQSIDQSINQANQSIAPINYFYTWLPFHRFLLSESNYLIFANNRNDQNVGPQTSMIFAWKFDASGLAHVSSAPHRSHSLWHTNTETSFQKIKLLIPSIS